jgi:hypothetical protein
MRAVEPTAPSEPAHAGPDAGAADEAAKPGRSWLWASWILLLIVQLDYLVLSLIPAKGRVSSPTLRFDRWLFNGSLPTTWLQHHLYHRGSAAWWDYPVTAIYFTHFLVWPVLAVYLWRTSRPGFRRFMKVFIPLTFAGYATYVLLPVSPPWLAALSHQLGPVSRVVPNTASHLGFGEIVEVFPRKNITLATVGAVPSLHAAYPLVYLLMYLRTGRRRLVPILAAYVPAMAFTLVYAGEHYVGDILIGWAYALIAVFVLDYPRSETRERRRTARDARRAARAS